MEPPTVASLLQEASQGRPTPPAAPVGRAPPGATREPQLPYSSINPNPNASLESPQSIGDENFRKRTLIGNILTLQARFPDTSFEEVTDHHANLSSLSEGELIGLLHTFRTKVGGSVLMPRGEMALTLLGEAGNYQWGLNTLVARLRDDVGLQDMIEQWLPDDGPIVQLIQALYAIGSHVKAAFNETSYTSRRERRILAQACQDTYATPVESPKQHQNALSSSRDGVLRGGQNRVGDESDSGETE